MIGIVAWPPQVTMLTFFASINPLRFTLGTQYGPTAAGVRSIATIPAAASAGASTFSCAVALVASNAILISGFRTTAATPSVETGIPSPAARRIPSDSTIPVISAISKYGLRMILYIRSLPIFPGPITATLTFSVCFK